MDEFLTQYKNKDNKTINFLTKSFKIHGNKYNYSKTEYINQNKQKKNFVEII